MRTISRCPCETRRWMSASTAVARRLRVAPRTSGMTQNEHENEQPSWIFTNARVRSSRVSARTQPIAPTSPATAAGTSSLGTREDCHVRRDRLERAVEVRSASRHVDTAVSARRARDGLPGLRDGLVRDTARVHDSDLGTVGDLDVTLLEQALAHGLRVRVRHLAPEKAHGNVAIEPAQRPRRRLNATCHGEDVCRPALELEPVDRAPAAHVRPSGRSTRTSPRSRQAHATRAFDDRQLDVRDEHVRGRKLLSRTSARKTSMSTSLALLCRGRPRPRPRRHRLP